ncbi:MAG: response regulator [Anaerohalosphaeraceae bacterium]|jgi:DNA-binding response OmpR family regulator
MSPHKMLIVDDEPDILRLLSKHFTLSGYEVLTATTATDALILAHTQRPDIILLDVLLPGMDGGEVARRLRTIPETADTPVIFLTGMFPRCDDSRPYRITPEHITFSKPIDIKELHDAVEGLISRTA